jgi:hypothetical protein
MMVKSIEPRPAFVEYEKRFTARPAYARVREQAGKYIAQLKG